MADQFDLAAALAKINETYGGSPVASSLGTALSSTPINFSYGTSPWAQFGATIAKGLVGGGLQGYAGAQQQLFNTDAKSALLGALAGKTITAADVGGSEGAAADINTAAGLKIWEQGQAAKQAQQLAAVEVQKQLAVEQGKAAFKFAAENPGIAMPSIFGMSSGPKVNADESTGAVKPGVGSDIAEYVASGVPVDTAKQLAAKKAEMNMAKTADFLKSLDDGSAAQSVIKAKAVQEAASVKNLKYNSPLSNVQEGFDYLTQSLSPDSRDRNQARNFIDNTLNAESLANMAEGLKGSTSDKDLQFIVNTGKAGVVDAESAKRLGLVMEQAAQRKVDYGQFARLLIANNKTPEEVQAAWSQYTNENPLINMIDEKAPNPTPWKQYFGLEQPAKTEAAAAPVLPATSADSVSQFQAMKADLASRGVPKEQAIAQLKQAFPELK